MTTHGEVVSDILSEGCKMIAIMAGVIIMLVVAVIVLLVMVLT